ncbi:MAG: hypothetical protein K2Q21_09710 [Chitinophagaceae bacterium]|nr:hypothetical protein [Chitinophagaceae bacterium]
MQCIQRFTWILCLLFFVACNSSHRIQYNPTQKFSATALKEDAQLLQKILEANHPSLYWYTPKEAMDQYFADAINHISDSLTEFQFRNRMAELVSHIRCGHTVVRFSKKYSKYFLKYRSLQFPLAIKTWGDSMVVIGSAFPKSVSGKRGTIISSINGRSNQIILNSMFRFISVDGNSEHYKSQLISNNFGAWYKGIFGLDSNYIIRYIDSNGKSGIDTLKNFNPRMQDKSTFDSLQKMFAGFKKPTRKELKKARLNAERSMQIDTLNRTMYMRLTGFSGGGLEQFFRKTFRNIEENKLKNLVIDLRENGGGRVINNIRLTRYLSNHPFRVADTVAAISRKLEYGKYISKSFWYWLQLNLETRKETDGKYHYRRLETKLYQPYSKNHFDGKVYLIQGAYTFSAASMFTANLKGQENIKIVGEESGGGYYGNSAIHLPTIVLPNSKIQISLPIFRVVMDRTRPKGRGVMPDILVPPSSFAIQKGVDLKMEKVKQKIQE